MRLSANKNNGLAQRPLHSNPAVPTRVRKCESAVYAASHFSWSGAVPPSVPPFDRNSFRSSKWALGVGRSLSDDFDAAFVTRVAHVRHLQGRLATRLGRPPVHEGDKGEQPNPHDVLLRSLKFAEVVSGGSRKIAQVRRPGLKAADDQDGRMLRGQLA